MADDHPEPSPRRETPTEPQRQVAALERELAEVRRLLSQERQRTEELENKVRILDLTDDTIMLRDPADRIVFWNREAEKRYGWSQEEARGRVCHELLQTVFPGPLEEIRAQTISQGHWEGELQHRTRDGRVLIVDSRWAVLWDARGAPKAIMEINNEITKLRRTQEALSRSEEQYRTLFDLIPDAVWISDEHTIRLANTAGARLLGLDNPQELVGRPLLDLFPLDFHADVSRRTAQALTTDGTQPFERRKILSADGRILDVETAVASCLLDGRRHVLRVSRDVTAETEFVAALMEKDKEITQSAEKLAEMNTALRVLLADRERDIRQREENIKETLEHLVAPYLEKLKNSRLDREQRTYVELMASNLADVSSSLIRRLAHWKTKLTPTEIQVADLIAAGKSSKEIAELLRVSTSAVGFHRANIRAKLGLRGQGVNLATFLGTYPGN